VKSRLLLMFCAALAIQTLFTASSPLRAQEVAATAGVPVRMTVTTSVAEGKTMPAIGKEDVVVTKDKTKLPVTEWVAAQGDRAGLDLFILLDDASASSLGSHLDDLRAFINAQAATTSVGVGYMNNARVTIVQNFTTNHQDAAKGLRLPMGSAGAYGSPFLSVVDLMKRWPVNHNRREVVMVTDGIDRARRTKSRRGFTMNPDVDTAGDVAQRTGTIIHTIYNPGVGHLGRNYWEVNNGQLGIAKLSDLTGGESFYLGTQTPVSFAPYLDQLQRILASQYLLTFSATPDKKAGLQSVDISTSVAGVDLDSADTVWVPAAK
jgi:hypothetical protein